MHRDPKNTLKDGWTNTLGGIDSGRATNLIDKDTLAFAVNATMREGYAETRPPFIKPKLVNDTDEIATWWAANETQGADYYAPVDKNPLLVVSIGGRIFKVDVLDSFRVEEITPTGSTTTVNSFISPTIGSNVSVTVTLADLIRVGMPLTIGDGDYTVISKANNVLTLRNDTATSGKSIPNPTTVVYLDPNPKNLPQAWMEQADEWLVVQNGKSAAFLYDGAIRRRATSREVPTGTAMVFNEEIGRLCVGLPTNEVAIGDITNPIEFTETEYLNEGGKFRIPRKFGKITGACMLANQDRSNGQGAMLFMTTKGITAFNLPPNRNLWKALTYPPQINMPIKGSTSHGSIVVVNGDVFYRSTDGVRSFALTRQDFAQWWNTPASREMARVLRTDDQKLLPFASAALFDNRLLFTVMPRMGRYAAYHRGMGVLDFDGVSSMGAKSKPRYDGVWTGIHPTHIVTGEFGGEERCFAFTRGTEGGVELWEILRKGDFDGDEGAITWWFETRALWGHPSDQHQFEIKRLESFEMWVDRVAGTVNFDLKYRPDQYPCWYDWDTKSVCQKFKDCDEEDDVCKVVTSYRAGYRSRLAFGQPPDTDESTDNKPSRHGYMFELRVQATGRARIKWGLVKATRQPEAATPEVTQDA